MSKRTREENAAANDEPLTQEARARKKLRKEKSRKDNASLDTAELERKKKPKKRVLEEAGADSADALPAVTETGSDAAEAAAKAEKKALRRAKKEAKAAKNAAKLAANTALEDSKPTKDAGGDDAKAVAKAARKAEKARLKALKTGQKIPIDTVAVISDEVDTPLKSSAHSKSQSSATIPEPTSIQQLNSAGYSEAPALSALPQSDVDAYLASKGITINDPTSATLKYRPIIDFSYLPITNETQRAPFASFSSPTPIQAAAWPFVLAGRDVVGVAETGSGKTLAFGVPCIRYISSLPKKQRKGVKAVMVSPTRELAVQIHEQLVKLAEPAGLKSVCVYGGVPKDEQRAALRTAHIVVATPGRLNDLIDETAADLSSVGFLVLDEADRMLDKGFEDAIRRIIETTPPASNRQTLMFTATWPQSVRELASTFMTAPIKITIGDNQTGELRANTSIEQIVEVVEGHDKQYRLLQLLKLHQSGKQKDDRILVFCLYKKEATRIEGFIKQKGLRVAGIHGDLSQSQRMASLDAFKQGTVPILVATDVAARGLDIPAVKLVINVTFPLTAEDYVHRIGRTGRAGKQGKAITFFTEQDKALSGALINVLKAANQPVPDELLKFGTTVKKKGHEAYGAFYKDIDETKKATKITFD